MSASNWWLAGVPSVLTALTGLLLGLLWGHAGIGAAIALGVVLIWEMRQLRRVLTWLHSDRVEEAPELSGDWGDVVGRIARLQRRKQYHKLRLLRLLRELRRSTGAIPDGVVILNPQAEILWFNRMAAKLLNLRPRSDIGLRIENLVRQPEFIRYLKRTDYAQPVVLRAVTAAEQFLQVQIVPYGTGQLLMLIRDVTRQERLEAMRKDFVANASHELRSPLTVIAGYLETLNLDPHLDPTLAGPVGEMRRQAVRMTGIIEDLLTLSRLEAESEALYGEPVDVVQLMEQLRRDTLARASHSLNVRVQADSSSRLLGDEAQLHSAFGNLVDNAAKYTPSGGSVVLRWWEDEAGGHFAVIDTGIGFAAEHIPRLTERFYRVDPGRSRATGGSGLGLAIVKHVLQRHGGHLEVASVEGHGSSFICHFPSERVVDVAGHPAASQAIRPAH